MNRAKKAFLTSITSLLHQVISIICGFILPRLFLANYGSSVNGLIASITQFLGFIGLAELGVGAVVQSSLYKPLAEKNTNEINKIFKSSDLFFRKIGFILLIYSALLAIVYPFIVSKEFSFVYTASLIIIISISTFAQHYVGMSYRLLLGADQFGFISQSLSCIALILNTLLCVLLIRADMPIHLVKFASSLVFLAQPLILQSIAKRKYAIDHSIILTEEPIKQKWNGLSQHIAAVVTGNTDTIVLTLLATLEDVSVYSVYHLVVNGVKSIVNAFTAGYISMFGNMLSNNEMQRVKIVFSAFEWVIHSVTTIAFGLTGVLIVPFVTVYTKGVTDYNYIVPVFGVLITIAQASYCLRLPYNIMVMAAGHYKQTQLSALIEAGLNIIISVVLVFRFGLIGVAIGTLIAMSYRTCYLAWYLSNNIINRKLYHFILHCIVDIICVIGIAFACRPFLTQVSNYIDWIVLSIKCSVVGLVIFGVINMVFYSKEIKSALKYLKHK